MIRFPSFAHGSKKVELFSLAGRLVRTIYKGTAREGVNEAYWDGRDEFGRDVPNGVYFYRLIVGETLLSKKIVLLRP